jgi:hypothetical protein
MLHLILLWLAICVCCNAQFSSLATPADGSRVYFATELRQKNTNQPLYGKLYSVDATGLKLFLSRDAQIPTPPPPGTFPIPLTNAYNLRGAGISSDGRVFAAVGIRYCDGAGEFCTRQEPFITTITAAGEGKDYMGDLHLSAGGTWAFGVSGVSPTGIFTGYLVNTATGQQTAIGTVFGRFQVAASGRPVADDGTAVYSDFTSLVVIHGTETRHIISAANAQPMDAVIDRAGGTIVFVSHDAVSVERLCERSVLLDGGRVSFDGPTREAVARYRRALADDANPAERRVGLREWGSGEATIASAELVGDEGSERLQFLSGEPFELHVAVAANGVPPPRLQLELRDDAGLLVAGHAVDLRSLGWTGGHGERGVRFHMGSLPLADGRFHLRLGLTDEAGEHVYHWLDDALVFVVYPGDDVQGVVRFEGTWMLEQNSATK